jgi:hypothetical protein
MTMFPTRRTALFLLPAACLLLPAAGQADCTAASGPQRMPLLELYTSEGCSSCPPAERTLERLDAAKPRAGDWIPLALHVDYWDELGWTDPYALRMATERQRWFARLQGSRNVYTPQVLVDGTPASADESDLRDTLAQAGHDPAAARLQLSIDRQEGATRVHAQAQAPAQGRLALHVAVAQNGLQSRVLRGENGGSTLRHAHVARAWQGPVPLQDGRAGLDWTLDAAQRAALDQGELVAFVQDQASGRVLQALRLSSCSPPS